MNLYRSFGNLMEAWVNEGNMYTDPPTPSSDSGTNFRSQSVDSGVETASSDTSFPSSSCFFPSENAETDTFMPEAQSSGLTPASTSESPVLSSPVLSSPPSSFSPLCAATKPEESPNAVLLKLEQSQQRTEPQPQRNNPGPVTVEEVLRRQPRAAFLPKRHASELMRGQRSDCYGLRRIANASVSPKQMLDTRRRPMSLRCDMQRLEECNEEERTGLSPGLCYLEQVCQMLEEVARQQIQNSTTLTEFHAPRENGDVQAPDSCQTAAEEALASCQRLKNVENEEQVSTEPPQRKNYGHYRQRSSSDTTHMNSDCRGQHLRRNDPLETTEEEHLKEETKTDETKKTTWRSKIATLRREMSSVRDTRGQQMESTEKNTARRRLSQLFRRRKTLPVRVDQLPVAP
ncbi:hypothetical protein JOB18_032787 [Solea senegalensis]|uniref:Uncharacterized protein n=1 Tax=Solea senegalensis TaxID=28829 RepID=A0AAV6R4M3_SOLSE|nr:uncharacterized protein si:dkey-106l3.7 [Solea senegalensis]KAG7499231.1 hypothetical protein JOB18_032787 [Solea senegalensis]